MGEIGIQGIFFESHGNRLLGTLFLARGEKPKATMVLLHGMPGIEKNYDLALFLRTIGWNSLIFHYQGCWGSEGLFNIRSIPEDVNSAINELTMGKYPKVDVEKIFLFGHSLGGWAAILVAVKDVRVKGVVAVAPITIPSEFLMTYQSAAEKICPWLQGINPKDLLDQWSSLDDEFIPIRHVANISPRSLLILHGGQDDLVAISHSKTLYEQALEPKELFIQPDADHSFVWHRDWLQEHLQSWLNKITPVF